MGDVVQTEGHALLKAVSQGKLRLARLLLEGGAYINEGNDRGETALSAACTARYQDPHLRPRMVRYLLDQGADPNMADTGGRTALMHAVHQRAGVHVVSLLLKHGADPSLKDYSGESALTLALVHTLQEDHLSPDQDHLSPDQDSTVIRDRSKTTERSMIRDSSVRSSLQLLLEACERRGQEVLILTCCWSEGHRMVRQYHHTPPNHHHLSSAPERLPLNHRRPPHNQNQTRISVNGLAPEPLPPPAPGHVTSTKDSALSAEMPTLSITDPGLSATDPAPSVPDSVPAPVHSSEPLSAASPSDIYVANANANEGVFSFSEAPRPRPPRPHRALKRLNSEPWGLTVPRPALPQPPPQDEEDETVMTPSLAERPQRRHSIETHDPGLSDQLSDKLTDELTERIKLTDRLTQELTLTDELRQDQNDETISSNCTDKPAAEEDSAQTWRRRFNIPSPLPLATRGSSENLSSSPLVTRHGRHGVGLLERRGSGTLLLDHLSQPRPGFLPPLFNQRPITDLRVANPASCSNPTPCVANANCANSANPKRELRKKKLLRRHSMQPEQMKLLSVFQQVLSENEEK